MSRPLRRVLRVYAAKFRTEIALQFAYRGALVIWMLGLLLEPTVYLVVWTTVARSQGGSVGPFAAADFAAYFTVLMLVNQLTVTWHFWYFEWRVRTGFFSPVLLRPVHPIHNDVVENLTFKMLTFTVLAPAAALLAVTFGARFATQPWHLVAFVPALLLAMLLRFVLEWSLALIAFWTTRTVAINQTWFLVFLFLSGQVAPLALLPPLAQAVASVLPFRWMVSFPVELALGRLGPAEVLAGLAAQIAWVGVAFVVLRFGWRAGIRRYSAVGT